MSEREKLQEYFYNYAATHGFNAPYGIIAGQESFIPKARTLIFGRARTLDLTMRIVNPKLIEIKDSRNGVQYFRGTDAAKSVEEYLNTL